ncbi:MAG: Non-histone chromosomal protein 6 [Cyphobasidiales sp. Tagirdzhanova-0007]|nr:MAG: Non-histone chromosomal protein 6 [Cyphobasidiales sp. Tagirdzhanova-0007]
MVCLVSAFSHSIPLQPIVKEENPEASFGEMGKLLGAKWKELDDAGKKPYSDKAEEDKKRYEKEQGSYSAKAGGGEEEEDEE